MTHASLCGKMSRLEVSLTVDFVQRLSCGENWVLTPFQQSVRRNPEELPDSMKQGTRESTPLDGTI